MVSMDRSHPSSGHEDPEIEAKAKALEAFGSMIKGLIKHDKCFTDVLTQRSILHWGRHFCEKHKLVWGNDITIEECKNIFLSIQKAGVKKDALQFGQPTTTITKKKKKPLVSNTARI